MALNFFAGAKAAHIKQAEDNLYALSTPSPDDGIGRTLQSMFKTVGIKHPPEIRVSGMMGDGGRALLGKDAVLVNGNVSESVLKALTAHEGGHIIFGDSGETTKRQEFRADRFSVFVTGDSNALSDYLRKADSALQEEFQILRDVGLMGKMAAFLKGHRNSKMYGGIEERMANLQRPITDAEKSEFTSAIELYNSRKSASNKAEEIITAVSTAPVPLSPQTVKKLTTVSEALLKQNGALGIEEAYMAGSQKFPDKPVIKVNNRA